MDKHVHIPVQKHRSVVVEVPVEKPIEVNVIETTEKAQQDLTEAPQTWWSGAS